MSKEMLLKKIRQLIHSSIKNVEEEIKWGFPVFNKKDIDNVILEFFKKK